MKEGAASTGPREHIDGHACMDLLHGLMDPAEREQTFAHLAECPACEELLRSMCTEWERFRASPNLSMNGAGVLVSEAVPQAPRECSEGGIAAGLRRLWQLLNAHTAWVPRRYAVGLAVVALSLIVLLLPRGGDKEGSLRADWLLPMANDIRLREVGGIREDTLLANGLQAYERRETERAVELLSRAVAAGSLEVVRKMYLASALVHLGRHGEALPILESLRIERLPEPWSSEVAWTFYLALRAQKQRARADSVLHGLAESPGEIGERARRALPH